MPPPRMFLVESSQSDVEPDYLYTPSQLERMSPEELARLPDEELRRHPLMDQFLRRSIEQLRERRATRLSLRRRRPVIPVDDDDIIVIPETPEPEVVIVSTDEGGSSNATTESAWTDEVSDTQLLNAG